MTQSKRAGRKPAQKNPETPAEAVPESDYRIAAPRRITSGITEFHGACDQFANVIRTEIVARNATGQAAINEICTHLAEDMRHIVSGVHQILGIRPDKKDRDAEEDG